MWISSSQITSAFPAVSYSFVSYTMPHPRVLITVIHRSAHLYSLISLDDSVHFRSIVCDLFLGAGFIFTFLKLNVMFSLIKKTLS